MSVDLGTEYMKIAIVKPGIPMEIVLNKESRRKTPVIIAMKGKEREFGDVAVSLSNKIPVQSYMYLRDLLGKTLDNPVVEQYLKRFPYYQLKSDGHTSELIFEHNSETNFTVEELLGMILRKAREYASDFAEQKVDAAVITVPPYFTQAERRAVKRACELANIKLLQLMNDNTAVALNYGIFRRKDFNATGANYLFYDMGAQATVCTLVTFSLVKSKEDGYVEEVPQLTVKAVAFDRDLGGLEFQVRLRDYLAEKFHEHHPKIDISRNPKALAKLFREAERAKTVLSANSDYTAQVEGLVDDIDFKHRLSREQFEKLCEDLFKRVRRPIDEVLSISGITLGEIQQVLLFGGSTRIPRVQAELVEALAGVELGKSLNTDEAAAMGAVYQAAALSKGYRVKKFLVKDANQYPINVQFQRHVDSNDANVEQKMMDLTLFARNNLFPNRKLMTFNRHTDDFSFNIHYGDVSYLSSIDKRALGQTDLARVHVQGARAAYEKHHANSESKGIKAHFQLDESSFLVLDRIEFLFERNETEADRNETDDDASTLSKLGSKFSSLFSSGSSSTSEDAKNETVPPTNRTDNTTEETNVTNTTESSTPPPIRLITVREPLEYRLEILDYTDPTPEAHSKSLEKLNAMDARDQEIIALASAKNNLESFIYDTRDKLEHDATYKKSVTEEEKTKILDQLTEADNWLWDDGSTADIKAFKSKLTELKSFTKSLITRVREADLRPQKIQEFKEALNATEHFLQAARSLFVKKDDEEKPFTESDLNSLEKVIQEASSWRDQVLAEFEKLLPTETPKYFSNDFDDKINLLKRETNYLLNKAQRFVPKPKKTTTTKTPTENETKSETTPEEEEETTTTTTNPIVEEEVEETETKKSESDQDPHIDL